jgi:hypothetical protein
MSRASGLAGFSTSISPPANLSVGIITAVSLSISQDVSVVGVVTATSFIGDGSGIDLSANPSLPVSGIGINTEGGTVGTGVTLIDFRGAGISTVTVSSGIATVNITGGGSGGASVSISTEAPTSPSDGDLWFDNSDGNTYIWYDSQSVWVVSQTYGY